MLSARAEILDALKSQMRRLEGAHPASQERVSSSCSALDNLLPDKGFCRGTLIEWLSEPGSGAAGLALVAGREACREEGALVVIDPSRRFYPPAVAALGVDLTRLVFVCPKTKKDLLWALSQTLSCPGVAAVVCWPDKLDDRAFRRIQLAAERGRTLGLLLRPLSARYQPTWSEIQLLVTPFSPRPLGEGPGVRVQGIRRPSFGKTWASDTLTRVPSGCLSQREREFDPSATHRRLHVELLRSRGGNVGASVELEFDDEHGILKKFAPVAKAELARHVPMAAALAAGALGRRSARA